jgi:hypothetical protein
MRGSEKRIGRDAERAFNTWNRTKMRTFHCDSCGGLVYFENTSCLNCGAALAYLPDVAEVKALSPAEEQKWQSTTGSHYRLCQNYVDHDVCNWAVPADDSNPLCASCRLTRVIPDLRVEGNKLAWAKFEAAKRRLNYTLLGLGLPVTSKAEDPENGLFYEFLADSPGSPVLTGHDVGIITINLAEADDAERERRRVQLSEPYRTILGHFRHEVGHYYWDRFFADEENATAFRSVFGDEREDYAEALKRHYETGAPALWQEDFISSYATTHPWEDWAETWAHYLHMTDALETATSTGLSLAPHGANEPTLELSGRHPESFDSMVESWLSLTYLLNNLNRGLGFADGYPFILSDAVVTKLRFVHDIIGKVSSTGRQASLRPVTP